MEKTTDLVIGSSLGSELSGEEAGVLADLMGYRDVADGEFLIEEGVTDDTLHVLLSGKLEVVKHTGAGETASLAILRPGALAGEMSFVDGAVHTVGLRALTDCRVLSLRRKDFEEIHRGAPASRLQGDARRDALGAPYRAPDEPRVHRTQQLHLQTARPLLKRPRCRTVSSGTRPGRALRAALPRSG